ncbi:MAG: DUF167 domain-containing protein [Phycisphaerae bacterium]
MKNVDQLRLRQEAEGTLLPVKAVPGSSRDKIAGVLGDALKVTTSAAPENGKANKAIARTLAKALELGKRDVEIAAGATSPQKEFLVRGLSAGQLRQTIGEL